MSKADQIRAMREAKFSKPKKSRGGGESRPASAPGLPVVNENRGSKGRGGALDRSLDRGGANPKGGAVVPDTRQPAVGVAPGPRDTKPAFRKPLAKDKAKTLSATKPWEAEGLSRRTWYRRKEKAK